MPFARGGLPVHLIDNNLTKLNPIYFTIPRIKKRE